MSTMCYLDGKILPLAEAKVGVYDIGLLRGFGIYEALTTYNHKPFMFADHMARFRHSTGNLAIRIPISDAEIEDVLSTLIALNVEKGHEAVIRMVLTGGTALEGIQYDPEKPTFYILVEQLVHLTPDVFEQGSSVTLFDFQRQFPESKTTNYIQAVLLQEERKKAGAIEILYTARGEVLECATSNFFIVKDGTIITANEHILFGITRKVAIDVARKEFTVDERAVSVEEMWHADEAFLTSSFKDVVPVVKVGDCAIGDGKVGPVTKRVMELFKDFAHSE